MKMSGIINGGICTPHHNYNRLDESIMILNQKQTTIAYRCPHCGATVISLVGVFALTADMLRMKCPCGESELSVVYTKDKKIRLTVPCFLCPTPHNFMVSASLFFSSDILLFPCA